MCVDHHLFLFFFFKQKTAYEMRISDWSSDVCSSDLAAKNWPQNNLAKFAASRRRLTSARHERTPSTNLAERMLIRRRIHRCQGRSPCHDTPALRALEIGRASGRERVCQSV